MAYVQLNSTTREYESLLPVNLLSQLTPNAAMHTDANTAV